jgi:serine O-acetyltransferase
MQFWSTIRSDYYRFRALAGQPQGGGLWRAFLNPRMLPVISIRLACKLHGAGFGPLGKIVSLFNQMVFRVEAPARIVIGPGFVLPHPGGIVLGSARIGANVTVLQNVTLGARDFDGAYDLAKRPVLEDGCLIGAGAVVLGPVRIGRGATVAANSLALRDVPDGETAMGVPARLRGRSVAGKDAV